MECNIGEKGKAARLKLGITAVLGGLILAGIILTGILEGTFWWLGVGRNFWWRLFYMGSKSRVVL